MQHRTLYWLAAIGIVLIVAQDAAAWPRRHHHRCICPVSRQAPVAASMTTASADVGHVLGQLRVNFPGKTNDQIIQVLRDYVTHDDSTEKDRVRWLSERLHRAKRQKDIVEESQRLGGLVTYDYMLESDESRQVSPPGPLWLRKLLGDDFFGVVFQLNLCAAKITDANLQHLDDLNQLHVLALEETPVTDAGLEPVEVLTELQGIYLGETQITNAGLERLTRLTHLRELYLRNTSVTDVGLGHITGLTQLEELSLRYTQVTDAGLEHLKGLSHLEYLDLTGAKVTDAGVKKLQQALPNCKIKWTPPKHPLTEKDAS